MKKHKKTKLRLRTETIRTVNLNELKRDVVGGIIEPSAGNGHPLSCSHCDAE
jgi:hypothetical protein